MPRSPPGECPISWLRFGSYAAVGAVGSLGHYAVLVLLVEAAGADPLAGSMAGYLTGAVINYWLNYHVTFRSDAAHRVAAPRFFLIAGAGFGLNALLMLFLVALAGWHYLLGQVVSTGLVLVFNYSANSLWTFRTSHEQ